MELWVKAIHVMAVIAWMAGLFYLPRLFAYHADAPVGSDLSETFKVMERRLLKIIMSPAMIMAWIFGLWVAYLQDQFTDGWFHAKLFLVLLMTGLQGALGKWRKDFDADKNVKTAKFFKLINEVPTVLMIGIVILVILKPF